MIFLPTSGALVANRFRLRHPIGKGGMGQVWEAHDRELDSACAIKFILDHLARDPDARLRLVREARAVARLRSPHVVTILGVGEHADAMYLAMELLEGQTLASRLERTRRLDGVTTLAIVDQVVQVLDKAHAHGIVHRDLKPDNIWLGAGTPPFIKVLDFGVAKSTLKTGEKHTATGALMGTPHYMSPEQASGDREVDHRSDLWALAVIAMECLSSRRPFESSGLGDLLMKIMQSRPPLAQELDPTLPPALNLWWQRALAHDLDERFQTASDLALGLRLALGITVAPAGASPFAETARGTWGVAPVERVPTLVTHITPAPPLADGVPEAHGALAQALPAPEPLPAAAAAPHVLELAAAPAVVSPWALPPSLVSPLPALRPSSVAAAPAPGSPAPAWTEVDSTQVVEAPPPLTEPMTVRPEAPFPFSAVAGGSVGAVTQTARGRAAARRRWPLVAAAGGCMLALLSFTWWRLSEVPPGATLEQPVFEQPVVAATPEVVTAPLRAAGAEGVAAPNVAPAVAPVRPATAPEAARPADESVSGKSTPPSKSTGANVSRGTNKSTPASKSTASNESTQTSKRSPGKRSPGKRAAPGKSSAPPKGAPAGESAPSAAELQRRLGF